MTMHFYLNLTRIVLPSRMYYFWETRSMAMRKYHGYACSVRIRIGAFLRTWCPLTNTRFKFIANRSPSYASTSIDMWTFPAPGKTNASFHASLDVLTLYPTARLSLHRTFPKDPSLKFFTFKLLVALSGRGFVASPKLASYHHFFLVGPRASLSSSCVFSQPEVTNLNPLFLSSSWIRAFEYGNQKMG